jgi:hypothetical protein
MRIRPCLLLLLGSVAAASANVSGLWRVLDPSERQKAAIRAAWDTGDPTLRDEALTFCVTFGTHGGLSVQEVRNLPIRQDRQTIDPSSPRSNWLWSFGTAEDRMKLIDSDLIDQGLVARFGHPEGLANAVRAFESLKESFWGLGKDDTDESRARYRRMEALGPAFLKTLSEGDVWIIRQYCLSTPERSHECENLANSVSRDSIDDPETYVNLLRALSQKVHDVALEDHPNDWKGSSVKIDRNWARLEWGRADEAAEFLAQNPVAAFRIQPSRFLDSPIKPAMCALTRTPLGDAAVLPWLFDSDRDTSAVVLAMCSSRPSIILRAHQWKEEALSVQLGLGGSTVRFQRGLDTPS